MQSKALQTDSREGAPRRSVVLLARSLGVGGAERQLAALASGLLERGWRVSVVLFYGGGEFEQTLKARGVTVEVLGKRGRWDVAGFLPNLISLLRVIAPDIIYSFLEMPNLLAVAVRPLLRRAAIVWGVRSSDVDAWNYGLLHTAVFLMQSPMSRFAEAIIYNSNAGRRAAEQRGFDRDRGFVVPNGIDVDRFAPDPRRGAALRRELRVPDGDSLVGMLARLDPMKDHVTFFRAAALVSGSRADVRFICSARSEDDRARLGEMAVAAGLDRRLTIVGPGHDVITLLNAIDILVLSSAYGEGFPNIVGEAMACGVPCVVTGVGDAAAIVGELGKVVPPRREQQLAGAIVETLDHLPDPCAVRERVSSNFSVGRMIDETVRVFERVLRNSGSAR